MKPYDLTVEEAGEIALRAFDRTNTCAGYHAALAHEINIVIESKRLANADRYSTGRVVPGVNGVPNRTDLVDPDDFSGGG